MVHTLLKQEFRRTRGILASLCGFVVLLALIALATVRVPLLGGAANVTAAIAMGALTPLVQLALTVDLYRSTFGRQGYFAHGIPLRARTLMLTKYLYGVLASLVALLVTFTALWILGRADALRGGSQWKSAVTGVRTLWEQHPWLTIAGVIFALLIVCAYLAQLHFAVVVGSEPWIRRAGAMGPVVTYILVYLGMQAVGIVSLLIPPLYNLQTTTFQWAVPLMELLGEETTPALPVVVFVLPILASAVLLWRAVTGVERRLELL